MDRYVQVLKKRKLEEGNKDDERIILTPNTCWYDYFKLPKELQIKQLSDEFNVLWDMKPATKHKIRMFGKEIETPRFSQAYGQDYNYSGTVAKAIPIPDILKKYLDHFSERYKCIYNMSLLNWYDGGEHYIGMHSDDEKQIEKGTPVITISFGATRKFRIKSKTKNENGKFPLDTTLYIENNQVLVMGGDFQTHLLHGIPKETKISGKRISVTLRAFKN